MECKCGCGQEIVWKAHHKYYGIPKYLPGHSLIGKLKTKRETIKCLNCGKEFNDKITQKRKFCCIECYWENLKGVFGKDHWNWKGGKINLNKNIRVSAKYKHWRLMIFGRDNFTCQKCGSRGCYLEAHHIKKLSTILYENNIKNIKEAYECKKLWDLNNGKTLCIKCHIKIDKKRGRFKNGSKKN